MRAACWFVMIAGRPVKVEGNPAHPASLGATDAIAQAEILGFYDPDRAAGIARGGVPQSWQNLQTALATQRARWGETHGAGLRILTGSVTSPSLARQIAVLQQRYPAMRWHQWEPLPRDAVGEAAIRAYGSRCAATALDRADVIVAIDSDLLCSAPGHVRFARDFASRRNPVRAQMSRVYAIEPTPTLIGAAADHRLAAGPRDTAPHRAGTGRYGAARRGISGRRAGLVARSGSRSAALAGRAFVHVGPHQPAETTRAGARHERGVGRAWHHLRSDRAGGSVPSSRRSRCGSSWTTCMPGAPTAWCHRQQSCLHRAGALGFAEALRRVAFSLALTVEPNETQPRVQWSLPQTHPLRGLERCARL